MHPVTLKRAHSSIHGSLTQKVVGAAVDQQLSSLAGCFSQATPGSLRHTQSVRVFISPSGAVQTALLAQSEAVDRLIKTCVEAQTRQWSFPKPKGGGIVILDQSFTLTQS
jgi:DNA-binding FadR family transcriptional regulator